MRGGRARRRSWRGGPSGWGSRRGRRAAALRALGRGVAAARVPLRVGMAGALWSEVAAGCRGNGGEEASLLQRLEAAAHVPARLVLTAASWMARRPDARQEDHEEGWAECS